MRYYDSEEEFLSVYTAFKLIEGGRPVITKNELENARDKFLASVYCYGNLHEPLKKLNFDNLQKINEKFQQRASRNRRWLKPCFVYKNEKLYHTYEFFDFTQTTHGEFLSFLSDNNRYKMLSKDVIKVDLARVDKKYFIIAKKVADYLTQEFAKRYIDIEIKKGRWPNHMRDLSNLFNKDLGTILGLAGTKHYFEQFNNYAFASIAMLIHSGKGNLILSDVKYGNLEYNNLKRILNNAPLLDKMCSAFYEKGESKFDIVIQNDVVKCNEKTLVDFDPYGYFSDTYSKNEKIL